MFEGLYTGAKPVVSAIVNLAAYLIDIVARIVKRITRVKVLRPCA